MCIRDRHIGAYQITKQSSKLTFIDTPGHAAFTEMRARGSKLTDIVVLVVAADDGVKPQTIESIKHAKAANVPIVVAINKCDLHDADPQKIKNQLLEHELIAEDLSGDTLMIEVSTKTKKNLDKLVESIFLQAENAIRPPPMYLYILLFTIIMTQNIYVGTLRKCENTHDPTHIRLSLIHI